MTHETNGMMPDPNFCDVCLRPKQTHFGGPCVDRSKTPDTKPVEGLGEATPFPFKVVADPNMRPGEWKLQFENERGALVMDLPAMGIPDILVPRIFKSVTSYDALTQRVKELEAEIEKWRGHQCGGVPEYRELGTTGMITDRRGDVWKKA